MKTSIQYFLEYVFNSQGSILEILFALLILLALILIVSFFYRRYLIKRCNRKEYWLPIVEDGGYVIGRVARSVSMENPGVYQHPVIRILVYKSGAICLMPRTYELCPDVGKFDHPYECMMEYGVSIEAALHEMQKKYFPKSAPPQFLLKYKHENAIGKWQVLLYILRIKDESELIGLDKSKSKFWSIQQIQENLGKSYFSAFLEGEVSFLKTISELNG